MFDGFVLELLPHFGNVVLIGKNGMLYNNMPSNPMTSYALTLYSKQWHPAAYARKAKIAKMLTLVEEGSERNECCLLFPYFCLWGIFNKLYVTKL